MSKPKTKKQPATAQPDSPALSLARARSEHANMMLARGRLAMALGEIAMAAPLVVWSTDSLNGAMAAAHDHLQDAISMLEREITAREKQLRAGGIAPAKWMPVK